MSSNLRVIVVCILTSLLGLSIDYVPLGFNEDTFATDSLQQILSLLSSLDAHACSMIASLSFNGHSRVKDLWIFIGPSSSDSYDQYWPDSPVSQNGSMLDLRRSNRTSTPDQTSNPDTGVIPSSLHRRVATVPQHPTHGFPPSGPHHHRAATETNLFHPPYSSTPPLGNPRIVPGNGVRKPAPRAQLPVSVDLDAQDEEDHGHYRTSLASAVPSGCENMTGIGSLNRNRFNPNAHEPDILGTTGPPDDDDDETVHPHEENGPSASRRISAPRPTSMRSKAPPPLTSQLHDPPRISSPSNNESVPGTSQAQASVPLAENPPLLSPGMFRIRDSAFSANSIGTTGSCEVPIKWSGLGRPEGIGCIEEEPDQYPEDSVPRLASPAPALPGAWTIPAEELPVQNGEASRGADKGTARLQHSRNPDRSVHDVDARVASPELVHEENVRKSEAGLIGMMPPHQSQSRPGPSPLPRPSKESLVRTKHGSYDSPASPTKTGSRSGSTDRWVLVNLEGKDHLGHPSSPLASPTIPQTGDRCRKPSTNAVDKALGPSPAKAVVVVGAKDGKEGKAKAGGSGLRRLWSFSRPGKGADEVNSNMQLSTSRSHELSPNGHHERGASRSGRFRRTKLSRHFGPSESPEKPPDRVRVKLD